MSKTLKTKKRRLEWLAGGSIALVCVVTLIVPDVYAADPESNPNAERYARLNYLEVLSRDLRVMDAAAISLARENDIPIIVFSIHNAGAFVDVMSGGGLYTEISDKTDRN